METLAWTGVTVAVLLAVLVIVVQLVGMLTHPIGRAVIAAWTIIGIIGWALIGGVYLLWTHGG